MPSTHCFWSLVLCFILSVAKIFQKSWINFHEIYGKGFAWVYGTFTGLDLGVVPKMWGSAASFDFCCYMQGRNYWCYPSDIGVLVVSRFIVTTVTFTLLNRINRQATDPWLSAPWLRRWTVHFVIKIVINQPQPFGSPPWCLSGWWAQLWRYDCPA